MITANEFLDLLRAKDLIDPALIDGMRARLAQTTESVPAARVVDYLVEKGLLSEMLARRLLEQAEAARRLPPAAGPLDPGRLAPGNPSSSEGQESELGLAPVDDDPLDVAGAFDDGRGANEAGEGDSPAPGLILLDEEDSAPSRSGAAYAMIDDDPPYARPASVLPPAAGQSPAPPTGQAAPPASGQSPPTAPVDPSPPVTAPSPSAAPEVPRTFGTDPLEGGPPADPLATLPGTGPPAHGALPTKRRKRVNPWDSKLLIIGGGVLVLLAVLLPVLVWRITRHSAEEMLAAADADYRAGAYSRAIARYTEYLEAFPNDPPARISPAKVRRSLARMRQVVDAGTDWSAALETAETEIRLVSGEAAFESEARAELNAMLPTIAEGLAAEAYATKDPATVAEVERAVALVERYIPSSARPVKRMNDIRATLTLTRHELAREKRLVAALSEMAEAIDSDGGPDPAEAYAIRDALLREYSDLAGDARLLETIRRVSEAEGAVVEFIDHENKAEVAPPTEQSPVLVLAARRTVSQVPQSTPLTVYAQTPSAIYGLDGASGAVLWRRSRAGDLPLAAVTWTPQALDTAGSTDALIITGRSRIERVDAQTGHGAWAQTLEDAIIAEPLLHGQNAFVPTDGGKIVIVDIASGLRAGHVQFPQSLQTSPAIDRSRRTIYQLAEHSTLFVLSIDGRTCEQAVYLGHASGTVRVPPAVLGGYILVAVNDSIGRSTLHVYNIEEMERRGETVAPYTRLQEIPLGGAVDQAPLVKGQRALVATDRGEVKLLGASAPGEEFPLKVVAETRFDSAVTTHAAAESRSGLRFAWLGDDQVFLAGSELSPFDIQPSRRRLSPRPSVHSQCVSWQPLRVSGETLYHVRRDRGWPGIVVSGISTVDCQVRWETRLEAPLAAPPLVRGDRVTAITSTGSLYELSVDALAGSSDEPTIIDEPTASLSRGDLAQPVSRLIELDEGRIALIALPRSPSQSVTGENAASVAARGRIAVYDPGNAGSNFRWITLPAPLAATPVRIGSGLLVPCQSGEVLHLDPKTGRPLAGSAQLPMRVGKSARTFEPAVVADDEAWIAHDDQLHQVVKLERPRPHWEVTRSEPTDRLVIGRPAATGDLIYVLAADLSPTAGDASTPLRSDCLLLKWSLADGGAAASEMLYADTLIDGPVDLLPIESLLIAPPVSDAGPCWIGESGTLLRAAEPWDGTAMAYPPRVVGNRIHVVSAAGRWLELAAADGRLIASRRLPFAVGAGPIEVDGAWLLSDRAGAVFRVEKR